MLASFIRQPRAIGAIAPSSRWLARAMTAHASGASQVLELGAGNGAITRGLLEKFDLTQLVCVELDATLAKKLAKLNEHLCVQVGSAQRALAAWPTQRGPTAVVSSLPFRSLPPAVVDELKSALVSFFERNPDSWWVQFTYREGEPFDAGPGLCWEYRQRVWKNAPPAHVWVLKPKA